MTSVVPETPSSLPEDDGDTFVTLRPVPRVLGSDEQPVEPHQLASQAKKHQFNLPHCFHHLDASAFTTIDSSGNGCISVAQHKCVYNANLLNLMNDRDLMDYKSCPKRDTPIEDHTEPERSPPAAPPFEELTMVSGANDTIQGSSDYDCEMTVSEDVPPLVSDNGTNRCSAETEANDSDDDIPPLIYPGQDSGCYMCRRNSFVRRNWATETADGNYSSDGKMHVCAGSDNQDTDTTDSDDGPPELETPTGSSASSVSTNDDNSPTSAANDILDPTYNGLLRATEALRAMSDSLTEQLRRFVLTHPNTLSDAASDNTSGRSSVDMEQEKSGDTIRALPASSTETKNVQPTPPSTPDPDAHTSGREPDIAGYGQISWKNGIQQRWSFSTLRKVRNLKEAALSRLQEICLDSHDFNWAENTRTTREIHTETRHHRVVGTKTARLPETDGLGVSDIKRSLQPSKNETRDTVEIYKDDSKNTAHVLHIRARIAEHNMVRDNGLCYLCTRALNGEQAEITELIQFMSSQVQIRRQHCCGSCETDDVECDERRPQCSHCERSGSKCVYQNPANGQEIARLHQERSYLPEDSYMPAQVPNSDTVKAEKSHTDKDTDEVTGTLANTGTTDPFGNLTCTLTTAPGTTLANDREAMSSIVPAQHSGEIDHHLRLGSQGQLAGYGGQLTGTNACNETSPYSVPPVHDTIAPAGWNEDQGLDPTMFEWAATEAFGRMAISNSTTEDAATAVPDWSSVFGLDFVADGRIGNEEHAQNTVSDPSTTASAGYQERIDAMDAYANYLFGQMDVDNASIQMNFEAETRDNDEIAADAVAAGNDLIEVLEAEMKKYLTGNECPW
ncbi:hypothetical protein DFH09DRAFT_1077474 [Mycena vulgaris]|nr:hypothetical protein DFH09DRAFT_1077474 [Mycena vulgaris]